MRIVQKKDSRSVQFCFLREGEVFLSREDVSYMKVRAVEHFNAVRLSDGILKYFTRDDVVKHCPDAVLTLEEE